MTNKNKDSPSKMHLATEVSSTTNHQVSSLDTKTVSNNNNNGNGSQNKNDSNKNGNNTTNNNGFPTVQELADRTIDALLAEHPGELIRTGSPHIVNIDKCIFSFSCRKKKYTNKFVIPKRFAQHYQRIGDRIKRFPLHFESLHLVK